MLINSIYSVTRIYFFQIEITFSIDQSIFPTISKPHLKIIPDIIIGMIKAESVVTTDIIKKINDPWSNVQPSSIERRFERFFNNDKFFLMIFMILSLSILLKIIS